MSTRQKLVEYTGISRDTPACIRCFAVFADAWLYDWLAEISANVREAVGH